MWQVIYNITKKNGGTDTKAMGQTEPQFSPTLRALSVMIHTGESGKKYWFSLFLLIKSKNYILLDYFQVWTFNDQQIPLQHDDSYLPVEMRWNLDASCRNENS